MDEDLKIKAVGTKRVTIDFEQSLQDQEQQDNLKMILQQALAPNRPTQKLSAQQTFTQKIQQKLQQQQTQNNKIWQVQSAKNNMNNQIFQDDHQIQSGVNTSISSEEDQSSKESLEKRSLDIRNLQYMKYKSMDNESNSQNKGFIALETDEENKNKVYSILGIGQAMVDFSSFVTDKQLQDLNIQKDTRRLIDLDQRNQFVDGFKNFKVATGGSLANTIRGLAKLGETFQQQKGGLSLQKTNTFSGGGIHTPNLNGANEVHPQQKGDFKVAMGGLLGGDWLGQFFLKDIQQGGVEWVTTPQHGSQTGTVAVLTSEDAKRTFLTYTGSKETLHLDEELQKAIEKSKVIVLEGYLLEYGNAVNFFKHCIQIARKSKAKVVLTCGDPGLVQRQHALFKLVLQEKVDVLLGNLQEAMYLTNYLANPIYSQLQPPNAATSEKESLQLLFQKLGQYCSVLSITNGKDGSYIFQNCTQKYVEVPVVWTLKPPVDTCGAGDAYAAGFLLGYLQHLEGAQGQKAGEPKEGVQEINGQDVGFIASLCARQVISRIGAYLDDEEALSIYMFYRKWHLQKMQKLTQTRGKNNRLVLQVPRIEGVEGEGDGESEEEIRLEPENQTDTQSSNTNSQTSSPDSGKKGQQGQGNGKFQKEFHSQFETEKLKRMLAQVKL